MPESTIRVLVAEDEPTLLNLNAQFLRQKGFEVTEASDGEQAWALASRGGFDLVLLDVMMPGMSGWEVCKKIKASPTHKNVAVVMLTGIGETLNEMNSPLFAADGWLNKPFDFDVLERKLREALAKFGKRMPDGGSDFYASNDEPPPSVPSVGPSVAKASPKKKAAPKKAAPKKATKKAAKKAAPKKAAKKAAPKKAAKRAAPKKAAKKAAPKKAAKKAAPKKAAKKAAPKKAARR